MTKDDREDKENATGAAAFTKIARGLSDLFTVLSDFEQLPRRGRHEKDGKVFEYSFGTRTLREAAGEQEPREDERVKRRHRRRDVNRSELRSTSSSPSRTCSTSRSEIVFLFELPGVERKDIRCILDGDILLLEAKTGERLYRKETLIEGKLAGGPHLKLHNGVLEVRLSKHT